MGTETVIGNSATAAGSTTCPKCGFDQEERLDCRKCGIIFSKYYALHPSEKPAEANGAEPPNSPEPGDQELKLLVSEMQTQVRELSARFAEVDFEKAERNRLQKELMEIDQKLQGKLGELIARVEQYEKRLEDMPAPEQPQESGADLSAFEKRLTEIEDKLNGLSRLNHQFNDLVEKYGVNFQQILELRERWEGLQKEYEGVKPQIEIFRKELEENKPGHPVEEEIRATMCKYLDEFRRLLAASGKNQ